MSSRVLFLLLIAISLSSALKVLKDSSDCAHIRCNWEGNGDGCNFSKGQKFCYPLLLQLFKSVDNFVEELKKAYPLNKFTIDNATLPAKCEKKRLCCNVVSQDHKDEKDITAGDKLPNIVC